MKLWDQRSWSSFLECWVLSQLFHSSFTFIKRLFFLLASCLYGGVICMSEVIDVSPSSLDSILWNLGSSLAFHMMCSPYKLNKQGDNTQPLCTLFPILNQSVIPSLVLTVASWPAIRFLRRQVRWSLIPMSLRIPQFVVIHTVKSFSIVNEAEVDVFLELSCFSYDWTNVGHLISGSSTMSFISSSLAGRFFTTSPTCKALNIVHVKVV